MSDGEEGRGAVPGALLVLRHVILIDAAQPARDSGPWTIRIEDGVVAAVDPEATESGTEGVTEAGGTEAGTVTGADGGRLWALPGLVNCHDHLYSHELREPLPGLDLAGMRRWIDARDAFETLVRMARAAWGEMRMGILLIRDLGAIHGLNTVLARLISDRLVLGPDVVPSGRPIVMTGGHVWSFGREADGVDACRQAVREQAKAGARVIKIMASGGLSHYPAEDFRLMQYTDDELRAIIDEAHARGLPTCAHVFGADAVARVVELGIDSVEHGIEIDDATLETMVRRNVAYVPTMTNMARVASDDVRLGGTSRADVLTRDVVLPQQETFRRAHTAGVRIGVGTDSLGDYAAELRLMHEFGMSNEEIITAATVTGRSICGVDATGIRPGARADLVVYAEDPRADVTSLTRPRLVVRDGQVIPDIGPWSARDVTTG